MNILVIGGTGTLGRNIIPKIAKDKRIRRIRILSRCEFNQIDMASHCKDMPLDFLVGDVRDYDRLKKAMKDCEVVFHLAAMKNIDKAEYDPDECVKTNIEGTTNVIKACQNTGVKRALMTSTDKAVSPVNIYGATKLVAEKIFIQLGNRDVEICHPE